MVPPREFHQDVGDAEKLTAAETTEQGHTQGGEAVQAADQVVQPLLPAPSAVCLPLGRQKALHHLHTLHFMRGHISPGSQITMFHSYMRIGGS